MTASATGILFSWKQVDDLPDLRGVGQSGGRLDEGQFSVVYPNDCRPDRSGDVSG